MRRQGRWEDQGSQEILKLRLTGGLGFSFHSDRRSKLASIKLFFFFISFSPQAAVSPVQSIFAYSTEQPLISVTGEIYWRPGCCILGHEPKTHLDLNSNPLDLRRNSPELQRPIVFRGTSLAPSEGTTPYWENQGSLWGFLVSQKNLEMN